MTDLESLVILNMVEGLGSVRLGSLLDAFGSPQKILTVGLKQLQQIPGIGEAIAQNILNASREANVKKELSLAKQHKAKILTMHDKDYPSRLKEIYDPPILLYIKGEVIPPDDISIAIVGSRRASYYGLASAEKLARELAARGITVVSGMARGVDSASHKGALKAKGRTIAVLGSGLAHIYPPENGPLSKEISTSGAVVSEFPMETHPDKKNFPRRNRIISGLSLGVVVVEAAQRSGALITANFALEQGREVFAVPGKVDSFTSKGTHSLIKEGAKLVETADDIIEELQCILEHDHNEPGTKEKESGARMLFEPKLAGDESVIYGLLSSEPHHIDEIARMSGLPVSRVSSILLKLELKKLLKQLSGKMFVKKSVN